MALLFVTGVVNYLDRANLSIVAPALPSEYKFDTIQMGWLFSAFGWAYAAMQLPAGWLADRVRPATLYSVSIFLWSLSTFYLGFASSLMMLVILRMAIGVFESPSYLINNRIVVTWFPENERALTVAIYTSAQFVTLAFLAPVLGWISTSFGWSVVFLFSGFVGGVLSLAWLAYREPHRFKGLNQTELRLIVDGGGIPDIDQRATASRASGESERELVALWIVLGRRKLWGLYIGQYALGTVQSFFFTWFPTYLVQFRQIDFLRAGIFTAIPFTAGFCGVLLSGFLSDLAVRRGVPLSSARKAPVILGLSLSMTIFAVSHVESEWLVVALFSVVFFSNGLASITWSLVASIAPERLIGLTGSMFNVSGWLAGITTPIVVGYLAQHDFNLALSFVGVVTLCGVMSYVFLVGKVERIVGS